MAVGMIAFVIGYALILRIEETLTYATVFLPTMVLIGVGFALCFPMLNIQATAGIADEEQGVASGLVQTSFQVGGAIVLAVITAIVTAQATGSPSQVVDGYRVALEVVLAVSALGLAIVFGGLVAERRTAPAVQTEAQAS
jgi:MFS family permease